MTYLEFHRRWKSYCNDTDKRKPWYSCGSIRDLANVTGIPAETLNCIESGILPDPVNARSLCARALNKYFRVSFSLKQWSRHMDSDLMPRR